MHCFCLLSCAVCRQNFGPHAPDSKLQCTKFGLLNRGSVLIVDRLTPLLASSWVILIDRWRYSVANQRV